MLPFGWWKYKKHFPGNFKYSSFITCIVLLHFLLGPLSDLAYKLSQNDHPLNFKLGRFSDMKIA